MNPNPDTSQTSMTFNQNYSFIGDDYAVMESDEEEVSLSLVGKLFVYKSPKMENFKSHFTKLWKVDGKLIINKMDTGIYFFEFAHAADKNKVLNGGPWHFYSSLLVLADLPCGTSYQTVSFTHTKMWVRVHDLPRSGFKEKLARKIGEVLGGASQVDIPDLKDRFNAHKQKFFRILIDWDIRNPLIPEYTFGITNTIAYHVRFSYEGLPEYCYWCGRIGHVVKTCSELKGEEPVSLPFKDKLRAENFYHNKEEEDIVGINRRRIVQPEQRQQNTEGEKGSGASLNEPNPEESGQPRTEQGMQNGQRVTWDDNDRAECKQPSNRWAQDTRSAGHYPVSYNPHMYQLGHQTSGPNTYQTSDTNQLQPHTQTPYPTYLNPTLSHPSLISIQPGMSQQLYNQPHMGYPTEYPQTYPTQAPTHTPHLLNPTTAMIPPVAPPHQVTFSLAPTNSYRPEHQPPTFAGTSHIPISPYIPPMTARNSMSNSSVNSHYTANAMPIHYINTAPNAWYAPYIPTPILQNQQNTNPFSPIRPQSLFQNSPPSTTTIIPEVSSGAIEGVSNSTVVFSATKSGRRSTKAKDNGTRKNNALAINKSSNDKSTDEYAVCFNEDGPQLSKKRKNAILAIEGIPSGSKE